METVPNMTKPKAWALRVGGGVTVPVTFVQAQARRVFFDTLHRITAESTQALTGPDANQVEQNWQDAQGIAMRVLRDAGRHDYIESAELRSHPFCAAAVTNKQSFIQQWQADYNLYDGWVKNYADATMWMAWAMATKGEEYVWPLDDSWNIETDIHDGLHSESEAHELAKRFRFTLDHRLVSRPVFLDHLWMSDEGLWEDDGCLGTFDPRTESIDAATDRLLEDLRARMHRALQNFCDEDRALNGAVAPVSFTSPKAFEWLVKYQVLTEDMDEIADAAGVSTQAVHKQIHKAKNAISLTLRERSKPGPKPGTTPNRVR